MQRNPSSGLTLIELLIVLCILCILGLSMPPISNLLAKQRLVSSQSELRLLVNRARAEALGLGQRITLCPLTPDGRCTTAWSGTLSVFTDSNGNRRQDPSEAVLYQLQLDHTVNLQWRGMRPANSLHFSAQGVTFVSNGTFSLCRLGYDETFRVIVSRQGRTRTDRVKLPCTGNSTI